MEKSDFIDAFVAAHCRTREEVLSRRIERWREEMRMHLVSIAEPVRLAAAAKAALERRGVPAAAKEQQTGTPVKFVYAADDKSWKCEVSVPLDADAAAMLEITLEAECKNGILTLAGMDLAVEGGVCEIPFGAFLEGLKDTRVAYGGAKGHLVFF